MVEYVLESLGYQFVLCRLAKIYLRVRGDENMSKLALDGGTPVRSRPFNGWPIVGEEEERAVVDVVRSGVWGLGGSRKPEFEKRFAEYQQAKYGFCVANGTVSLIVALRAAGVGAGDEVIVPPYTFAATASAVLEVNGIPVFVDIDPDTYCLDPDRIEMAITENTKAIIPVHIGGHPADMDRIMRIADTYNLVVIEDAAQAHGAEWKGKRVGAIGHMGSFSFQSSKNLACGEGGIILTNDDELADKCYSYHDCGRIRGGAKYEHHVLGQNYRMGEFQAAILLAQLDRLDEQIDRRNENAQYLSHGLSEIDGIVPLNRDSRVTRHGYHIYIFKYLKKHFDDLPRNKFIKAMNAEGIPIGTGYSPLYKEILFRAKSNECPLRCALNKSQQDYAQVYCPEAEKAGAEEGVWMGQSVLLGTKADMDDIAEAIFKVKANREELR